jgi:hypothetical protein
MPATHLFASAQGRAGGARAPASTAKEGAGQGSARPPKKRRNRKNQVYKDCPGEDGPGGRQGQSNPLGESILVLESLEDNCWFERLDEYPGLSE